MIDNLEARSKKLYEALHSNSQRALEEVKHFFTEYFIGTTLEPHPDMTQLIAEASLGGEQTQLVEEYASLQCVEHALPRIAQEFVNVFPQYKYGSQFSLTGFLLSWDSEKKRFIDDENDLGTYSPVLINLINHLERTKELTGYAYHQELAFLEGIRGFTKLGLISILANNQELIHTSLGSSLKGRLKQDVEGILSDGIVINEAAQAFLNAYEQQRHSTQYALGLGHFLDRFDIIGNEFAGKKEGGQYRTLYTRLQKKYGTLWRKKFLESIDDSTLRERVHLLNEEIGNRGILEEDRIRFVEKLVEEGSLNALNLFADDGSDMTDVLLAMKLGRLNEEERQILKDIARGGRKIIGKYLGICRIPTPDGAVIYDARRCLLDVCRSVDRNSFAQNDTLAAILFHKMKDQYMADFMRDKEETKERLKKEIKETDNPVHQELLRMVLTHFDVRTRVGAIDHLVDRLIVVN